eukprot:sb/3479229/
MKVAMEYKNAKEGVRRYVQKMREKIDDEKEELANVRKNFTLLYYLSDVQISFLRLVLNGSRHPIPRLAIDILAAVKSDLTMSELNSTIRHMEVST